MPAIKAFVCGCEGTALSDDERRFIAEEQPWGLILFKRNVASQDQLLQLTQDFRDCVGRIDAPVLIDQEGGRVQRLGPPHWPAYPSAATYLQRQTGDGAVEAATLGGRLIATDLRHAGITVDCAPVLDVPALGSHQVIGNRAFGPDPDSVATLGRAFADGLLAGGVLPVIKHMPGHGRTGVDSHLELPVISASRAELEAVDFPPFQALADLPVGMTAHIVYTALDPDRPATTSPVVIDTIIRGLMGFSGLLLSDDLSMEALKGTLGERADAAARAGCDIVLHCNGKIDEVRQVAAVARPLEGERARRAERALAMIPPILPRLDDGLRARFTALTAA